MTDILTLALIAQYALLGVASFFAGQHGKTCYWVGALILTFGVYLMEG